MRTRAEFPDPGPTELLESDLDEVLSGVREWISPGSEGSSSGVVEEVWDLATVQTTADEGDRPARPFGRVLPIDLIRLALEVDVLTPEIRATVPEAIHQEGSGALLKLLSQSPRSSSVAQVLGADIVTPEFVLSIIVDSTVFGDRMTAALRWADAATLAPWLLTSLSSEHGEIRERVLYALKQLKGGVGPALMERLADATGRSESDQEFLHLAEDLAEIAPTQEGLFDHPNSGYRLVGISRLLESPKLHDRVLEYAFADSDPDVRSRALDEVRNRKLTETVDCVIETARDEKMPVNIRAKAVGILGSMRCEVGLETLADIALDRTIEGSWTLQPVSPEMIAAVNAFMRGTWRHTSVARRVHDLAGRSSHPDLRASAEAYGKGK